MIFVGTNADKLENSESSIKDCLKNMIDTLNTYTGFNIKDSIITSNKINNSAEIKKLSKILLSNTSIGRTIGGIAVEMMKFVFGERMQKLGIVYNCFCGNMTVSKKYNDSIQKIKIQDIEIGDYVEAGNGAFEKVLTKSIHYKRVSLLRIKTLKEELLITEDHYIPVLQSETMHNILAKDVKPEDFLLRKALGSYEKIKIEEIEKTLTNVVVNIRTASKTVMVNDYLCSTMINGDLGDFGQILLILGSFIHDQLPQKIKNFGLWCAEKILIPN